ncbi:MAG TPA: hypothetical protein VF122_07865 [Caulobacteraceae bacterium]
MKGPRAIAALLIAVLVVGGAMSAAAPAFAVQPACHDTGHQPPASEKHGPAVQAVNCCAGCLPAPAVAAAAAPGLAPAGLAPVASPAERLEGLSRSPDPDPPRPV